MKKNTKKKNLQGLPTHPAFCDWLDKLKPHEFVPLGFCKKNRSPLPHATLSITQLSDTPAVKHNRFESAIQKSKPKRDVLKNIALLNK